VVGDVAFLAYTRFAANCVADSQLVPLRKLRSRRNCAIASSWISRPGRSVSSGFSPDPPSSTGAGGGGESPPADCHNFVANVGPLSVSQGEEENVCAVSPGCMWPGVLAYGQRTVQK
jgi:hypothetical protein